MNKKIKLITIVGTRPEIIRLSIIIKRCDENFEHILVHTGQNYDYELNEIFFEDLNIRKPDYFLNTGSKTAIKTISKVIEKSEEVIIKEKPDAVVIYGDTNSCLSVISAKRNKIPIFHMEAGNRCFDQRVPEEINRKIVDHISDVNLTYSELSRKNLLREGKPTSTVIKVGSPMFEVYKKNQKKIDSSKILEKLCVQKKKFILFSTHREENTNSKKKLKNIVNTVSYLAKKFKYKIVFPCHPRIYKKINKLLPKNKKIIFLKPMGFFDYNKLIKSSFIFMSDSGTVNEEANILKINAINLRSSHERHEANDEASSIMTRINIKNISNAINIFEKNKDQKINTIKDYKVDNVSDKITKIILSNIDYININVWKKNIN